MKKKDQHATNSPLFRELYGDLGSLHFSSVVHREVHRPSQGKVFDHAFDSSISVSETMGLKNSAFTLYFF